MDFDWRAATSVQAAAGQSLRGLLATDGFVRRRTESRARCSRKTPVHASVGFLNSTTSAKQAIARVCGSAVVTRSVLHWAVCFRVW